ncbi:MAG: cupredoxin domain-containing protein [Candidatus Binataceae bacterium]
MMSAEARIGRKRIHRWIVIATLVAAALAPFYMALADDGYLPNAAASKIVTAVPNGAARTGVVILTITQPANQSDPEEMKAFGILYTYSPRVIFVRRDEPTSFSFWNLQSDEHHDFMLADPAGQVMMKMGLPELKKTQITLTFHKEGLYTFYCTMHQPEMSGQIYVLAPR